MIASLGYDGNMRINSEVLEHPGLASAGGRHDEPLPRACELDL